MVLLLRQGHGEDGFFARKKIVGCKGGFERIRAEAVDRCAEPFFGVAVFFIPKHDFFDNGGNFLCGVHVFEQSSQALLFAPRSANENAANGSGFFRKRAEGTFTDANAAMRAFRGIHGDALAVLRYGARGTALRCGAILASAAKRSVKREGAASFDANVV